MKCQYRNCKNEITGRPNKKFCKVQCKRNELKYKQRTKKKIKKDDSHKDSKFWFESIQFKSF
jgi:hypothetical protein